ncbi:hypothetical protein IGB11_02465 [Ligilactobacillus salivarius]|uniref:hypothetical protein n=1 Tax=Ligilactobacillus salivarius TaxID=1624 RepID=UPI0017829B47|nr:hypothetical protein [Ligilactobacillus salivarius]QXL49869.1 hypothetical protein IGB11_02465 [Ligilactobacillus salivarius]
MKINFNDEKPENIYKVGNVIRNSDNMLFLVAEGSEFGYVLVNLSENMVTRTYETLEELSKEFGEEDYIDVHGGVTFKGYLMTGEEKVRVIGFDTMHWGDSPTY